MQQPYPVSQIFYYLELGIQSLTANAAAIATSVVTTDDGSAEKKRQNCQLLPSEPLPFSPNKADPSTHLAIGDSRIDSTIDSLYPNPPSPEGIDVMSYNSRRATLAEEV